MEANYLPGYATDRTILQLREFFEEAKRVAGVTPANDPPSTLTIFQMVDLAYRGSEIPADALSGKVERTEDGGVCLYLSWGGRPFMRLYCTETMWPYGRP